MNKFLTGLTVLALLASTSAYAAVYNYTGQNYTSVNGAYTTSMRVTGSFSTSSPIPPNSVDFDATGIVTSWSFSDGLQTINNTNGVIYPDSFSFSTDGLGNITAADIAVVNSPLATQVNQTNDVIVISSSDDEGPGNFVGVDVICTAVTDGICSDFVEGQDFANADGAGVWIKSGDAVGIPTLSTWGLAALILLLGTFAFARRRQIS